MKTVRLGDICEIKKGKKPSGLGDAAGSGRVRALQIGDLHGDSPIVYCDADDNAVIAEESDVLIAWDGANAATTSHGLRGAIGSTLARLRIKDQDVYSPYIGHYLKWRRADIRANATGATIPHVDGRYLKSLEVPLPSLAEQRRIAGVLSRVNALYGKVAETLNFYSMLETSKSALLIESCATSVKIGDFIESSQYGTSKKSENVGPTPVLRMGNITDDGNVSVADLKYTDIQDEEAGKYTLREGDLLFNRTNSVEKVGKAAVVHGLDGYAYAGYLIRIRFKEGLHPEYVSAFLRSPRGVATRKSLAKTAVNQANINAKEFAGIEIPFPSSAEQEALVRTISYVRSQQKKMVRVLNQLEELRSALQYRAFRGEL